MANFDDLGRTVLRNRLLGRWAAERLGKAGGEADAYVETLAAMAAENGDVFSRVKQDFDAAGVAHTDASIGEALTEMTVKAGRLLPTGGGGVSDAAAIALKRNLSGR
ncbi:MAG: ATPase inhibitor subunit zeta [Alsobacter sp.]